MELERAFSKDHLIIVPFTFVVIAVMLIVVIIIVVIVHKFNFITKERPRHYISLLLEIILSNERPTGLLSDSPLAAITGPWQLQSGSRGAASASLSTQQRAGLHYIHQHGGSGGSTIYQWRRFYRIISNCIIIVGLSLRGGIFLQQFTFTQPVKHICFLQNLMVYCDFNASPQLRPILSQLNSTGTHTFISPRSILIISIYV